MFFFYLLVSSHTVISPSKTTKLKDVARWFFFRDITVGEQAILMQKSIHAIWFVLLYIWEFENAKVYNAETIPHTRMFI